MSWYIKNGKLYDKSRNHSCLFPFAEELNEKYAKVSYGDTWGVVGPEEFNFIKCIYDIIYIVKIEDEDYIICGRDGKKFSNKLRFDNFEI